MQPPYQLCLLQAPPPLSSHWLGERDRDTIISCQAESAMEAASLFSTMNINKSKYQIQLSDAHLAAILKVSTAQSLRPNINKHRTEVLPVVWRNEAGFERVNSGQTA